MPGTRPGIGRIGYRERSENSYDSEDLVEFLINLLYTIAANLYMGSSEGSSSGGQTQQNP